MSNNLDLVVKYFRHKNLNFRFVEVDRVKWYALPDISKYFNLPPTLKPGISQQNRSSHKFRTRGDYAPKCHTANIEGLKEIAEKRKNAELFNLIYCIENNINEFDPNEHHIESWIYFIQIENNGPIKIGFANNVEERLRLFQVSSPYELNVLFKFRGIISTEQNLHKKFHHIKIRGEWFYPTYELREFINELKAKSFDTGEKS